MQSRFNVRESDLILISKFYRKANGFNEYGLLQLCSSGSIPPFPNHEGIFETTCLTSWIFFFDWIILTYVVVQHESFIGEYQQHSSMRERSWFWKEIYCKIIMKSLVLNSRPQSAKEHYGSLCSLHWVFNIASG